MDSETTHSTQFSFDESLICPTFISSPSLSNHVSNKSNKSSNSSSWNDDVVEAINYMENPNYMIVIKNPSYINKNIETEYNLTHLNMNDECIELLNDKIPIKNISKVNKLDDNNAINLHSILNINYNKYNNCLKEIILLGLQSITIRLIMKNNQNYFLIFDSYETCFIWFKGLKIIKHMSNIKQQITTIAFCVSSIDRINNQIMYQNMKNNNWINTIKNKLYNIQKYLNKCNDFVQLFCILDSTQHLSLLLQTKNLKQMYFDINKLLLIPENKLTKEQIISLKEIYLSLISYITVVILKESQLKNYIHISKKTKLI